MASGLGYDPSILFDGTYPWFLRYIHCLLPLPINCSGLRNLMDFGHPGHWHSAQIMIAPRPWNCGGSGIQKLQFTDQLIVIAPVESDPVVVTLAISPASVLEDGAPNLTYTFTRTGPLTSALTVNYILTGGSATFSTDYTQTGAASFDGLTGTVIFPKLRNGHHHH